MLETMERETMAKPKPLQKAEFSTSKDTVERLLERDKQRQAQGLPRMTPFNYGYKNGAIFPESAQSMSTSKPYGGINRILLPLMDMEHDTHIYLTRTKAKDWGGDIKEGATSYRVVHPTYVTHIHKETKKKLVTYGGGKSKPNTTEEEFKELKEKDLVITIVGKPKYSYVYNVEDAVGINFKFPDFKQDFPNKIDSEDWIPYLLSKMPNPPNITRNVGNVNYYRESTDTMNILPDMQWEDLERFVATVIHEIYHSTGHKSRVYRENVGHSKFGSKKYAKEELIAEIGTITLAKSLGIEIPIDNSDTYINGWLQALDDNPSMLFESVKEVDKATQYILGGVNG